MSTSVETIVRGPATSTAPAANFSMDLRSQQGMTGDIREQIRASATAAGYAAGWSAGHQAALRAHVDAAARVQAAADEAAAAGAAALRRALAAVTGAASALERRSVGDVETLEDLVLDCAYQIAEALIGRELTSGQEGAREVLRRALALLPPDGPVTVTLSPVDYTTLTGSDERDGAEHVYEGRRVMLRPDPALSAGDAVADCGSTTVDAQLSTAGARVREALRA